MPAALRRLAFTAVLVAGMAMLATSLTGLAGMSEELRVAGAPVEARLASAPVADRDWECDGGHWTAS